MPQMHGEQLRDLVAPAGQDFLPHPAVLSRTLHQRVAVTLPQAIQPGLVTQARHRLDEPTIAVQLDGARWYSRSVARKLLMSPTAADSSLARTSSSSRSRCAARSWWASAHTAGTSSSSRSS